MKDLSNDGKQVRARIMAPKAFKTKKELVRDSQPPNIMQGINDASRQMLQQITLLILLRGQCPFLYL